MKHVKDHTYISNVQVTKKFSELKTSSSKIVSFESILKSKEAACVYDGFYWRHLQHSAKTPQLQT